MRNGRLIRSPRPVRVPAMADLTAASILSNLKRERERLRPRNLGDKRLTAALRCGLADYFFALSYKPGRKQHDKERANRAGLERSIG